MSLGAASMLGCAWIVGAFLWTALIYACCRAHAQRRHEGWPSYWLAWVILAVAPPLAAPWFAMAPMPVLPLQLDAALVLIDLTAPMQRQGLPGGGVEAIALLLAGVVCVGVAGRMGGALRDLRRVARLVNTARPAHDIAAEAAVRLLVSNADAPIFCTGGPRPAIVLPRSMLARLSPDQVRMVIEHEVAHVRRRDPILFLMLEILDVLFWFSPFARRLTQRARLAAEIACDAIALQPATAEPNAYARALVSALEPSAEAGGAVAAFGGRGEGPRLRLAHILNGGGRPQRLASLSLALVAGSVALSLSGAAFAATTARLSSFGDPTFLAAIEARVIALYAHAPRCEAISGEAP